jgi:Tol biopolymer transport system component
MKLNNKLHQLSVSRKLPELKRIGCYFKTAKLIFCTNQENHQHTDKYYKNSTSFSLVTTHNVYIAKASVNPVHRGFVREKKNLAPSYCSRQQPTNYRRRSSVSQLSSGWGQSGSTAP